MNNKLPDSRQFTIDLVFKPVTPGHKVNPEEIQLLLAYIGEILKEVEEEERKEPFVIADKTGPGTEQV